MRVDEEHRALIALNNAGVSLFRCNLYEEALAAFTEASAVMQAAALETEVSEEAQKQREDDIQSALRKARQQSALLTSIRSTISDPPFNTFDVSSHDDFSSVHRLLWANIDKLTHVCISIDPTGPDEVSGGDDMKLDYAILLYNYGIANSSLAYHSTDFFCSFSFQMCCLHVLPIAETMLSDLLPGIESDNVLCNRLLVPQLLLTWKLIQSTANWHPHISRYLKKYHSLIGIIISQLMFLSGLRPSPAAAA